MAATLRAAKDQIFSLSYLLTEGAGKRSSPRAWGLLLLTVEMLQVVRVLIDPAYGWTSNSQEMARWFDLVAVVADQIRQWVPFLFLYILACLLVIAMLVDAGYIMKITRDGVLSVTWPLKMLRFLVATVATILFTTTLEWMLYPMDCLADDTSLSEWLHGNGSKCDAWGVPDVVLTVFSIILVLMFVIFSMGVNLFTFELNPIVRGSRVVCTGRVEVVWTTFKVAAGLLPFLSPLLSPLAVSIILSLFATRALYDHLHRLPFQSRSCNVWRGGVHATALWLCLASVINSALGPNHEGKQDVQWALMALVPLMFLAGNAGVMLRERVVHRFLNILRAEYDASMIERDNYMSEADDGSVLSPKARGSSVHAPKVQKVLGQDPLSSSRSEFAAVEASRRSAYEEFFDTAWKARRAFPSGADALLSCRHLLGLREEDNLPFLNFVLGKAIAEHPENLELQLFQLAVLRFIHCDAKQASDQEKKLQDKKGMLIDRTFQLFAVIRRATAEVSSSLGQAVNLMEFDSKMTAARKSHQTCLTLIRKFFQLTLKKEKSGSVAYGRPSPAVIDDMVACVHKYEAAVEDAQTEYSWLIEKFPQSTAVILSYAQFTDTVLNDIKGAKLLRIKAALLEDEGMIDRENENQDKNFLLEAGSSVSSDNDSRSNIAQFMLSWRNDISGTEYRNLSALQMRVQVTLVLILAVSTIGFVLMDSVLFSEQANDNMQLIDASDLFRGLTVSAAFWLRSEMMASQTDDIPLYLENQELNDMGMQKMRRDHSDNFKYLHGGPVEEFYFTNRAVSTPSVGGWNDEEIDFWSFGNDFSRRGRLAAATAMEEFKDPNYQLSDISMEKRCVYYVQETAFREAIPFFDDVVTKYDENVRAFGDTAIMVVTLNVVINSLLVILLSYMTITTVRVLTTVQFQVVACRLALTLPRQTATKIYKFYDAEHHSLSVIGDEQAQQDDILNGESHFKELESGGEYKEHGKDGRASSSGSSDQGGAPHAQLEMGSRPTSNQSQNIEWGYKSEPLAREGSAKEGMANQGSAKNLLHSREDPLSPLSTSRTPSNSKGLKSALKSKNPYEMPPQLAGALSPSLHLTPDALVSLQRQLSDDASEHSNTPSGSVALQHYLAQENESNSMKDILTTFHPPKGGAAPKKMEVLPGAKSKATDKLSSSMGFVDKEEEEEEEEEEAEELSDGTGSQDLSEDEKGEEGGEEGVTVTGARFGGEEASFGGTSSADVSGPDHHKKHKRVSVEPSPEHHEIKKADDDDNDSVGSDNARKPLAESTPDELREMDPEVETDILKSVTALHHIHNRASTYVVVLLLTLAMCICSITIPSRFIGQMVNLGPTSNNAAYRRTLVKSCAHLARELVLNDGFSRMEQGEIAGTLKGILNQLRAADTAVRRGESRNVAQGADFWSPAHNAVMYDAGCPWYADGNCSDSAAKFSNVDYPSASAGGVYALALQFQESVETVLETYGGPHENWKDTFGEPRSEEDLVTVMFKTVIFDPAKAKLLDTDKPVRFVLGGFDGALFRGYTLVLDVLKKEMVAILDKVHFELRLMFGIYVALLLFGFYFVLFRRTISGSYSHTERARDFVQMLPTHALTRGEVQLLKDHFCGTKDDL